MVSQLLPEEVFKAVRFGVKNFQQVAADNDGHKTLFSNHLTVIENLKHSVFSQSYLSYLAAYKNNIISVSEPNTIALEANRNNFEQLFKKLVDEQGVMVEKK